MRLFSCKVITSSFFGGGQPASVLTLHYLQKPLICLILWIGFFSARVGFAEERVILLHGMGRTAISMWSMENFLRDHGFTVTNWNYDGFFTEIDELSQQFITLVESFPREDEIHIVAHSLGGIIVRDALSKSAQPNIGRIVMLAPPHHGSPKADLAAPYLSWLLWPIEDLVTGPQGLPERIGPMQSGEVAIIAAEDDILVPLSSTYLPEMKAHLVVDSGHTWIMNDSVTQEQTLHFLREGIFAWGLDP